MKSVINSPIPLRHEDPEADQIAVSDLARRVHLVLFKAHKRRGAEHMKIVRRQPRTPTQNSDSNSEEDCSRHVKSRVG